MTTTTMRMPFAHGDPAGPLRSRARAALTPWHPRDHIDDVLVVISELVQNVTLHTSGAGILILSWDDNASTIEVRDEDPRLPQPQPPDGHRLGGRGLLLVAGLCSSWGATPDRHGKTVWARLVVAADRDMRIPA